MTNKKKLTFPKLFIMSLLIMIGVEFIFTLTQTQTLKVFESKNLENAMHGIDTFRSNQWQTLRKALCGKGIPNQKQRLKLAKLFFHLARLEVFEGDVSVGRISVANLFFNHDTWGYQVYYGDPAFKVIYVRAWKCGNNQINNFHHQVFDNLKGELKFVDSIGKSLDTIRTTSGFTKDTCIYTAIRDPISHFLSGYNEVEHIILNKKRRRNGIKLKALAPFHNKVPYIFNRNMTFNNDGVSLETFHSLEFHDRRKKRFEEFVKDLLRQDANFYRDYRYFHVFAMSAMLTNLARKNVKLTGYIPTLSNLTSSWPKFISENCTGAPRLEDFPKLEIAGQHNSSKDPFFTYKAAYDVWNEGGNISRALCLLHTMDYSCWRDLPDGIPNLCMEMYEKYYDTIISTALPDEK